MASSFISDKKGADTVEANWLLGFPDDLRQYGEAKALLAALGISAIHLMTNKPRKIEALKSQGIDVIDRIALHTGENQQNFRYLRTKAEKTGHFTGGAMSQNKACGQTYN